MTWESMIFFIPNKLPIRIKAIPIKTLKNFSQKAIKITKSTNVDPATIRSFEINSGFVVFMEKINDIDIEMTSIHNSSEYYILRRL